MHAPRIPRFVRGHIYKLVKKGRPRSGPRGGPHSDMIVEFTRVVNTRRLSVFKSYQFKVLARALPGSSSVYTTVSVRSFSSEWSVECEVFHSELPLYLGMNSTKYFEQRIKSS